MAKVELGARRTFSNLKAALFTPWTDEKTLGDQEYDLVDIVADTTSVEQADNEVNTIEHEFSGAPLVENISLGEKTFTTECIDMQNDVLKGMFGWTTDEAGNAFAPKAYKPLYCKIELQFNSTEDIIVLPKVLLNSKAVLASMKTDVSRANISGTCYPAFVTAGTITKETDMAVVGKANATTYTVAGTGEETEE
jgi:hypothetical protein